MVSVNFLSYGKIGRLMWEIIKGWLGLGEKVDILPIMKEGALILDVRTVQEFEQGHVAGSINIPLHELDNRIGEIQKLKIPIIACCRTGRRSGVAARQLNKKGIETYNGGGWKAVEELLKST